MHLKQTNAIIFILLVLCSWHKYKMPHLSGNKKEEKKPKKTNAINPFFRRSYFEPQTQKGGHGRVVCLTCRQVKAALSQGCQMVYISNQNSKFGYILEGLAM
jgi:hypothetical protein